MSRHRPIAAPVLRCAALALSLSLIACASTDPSQGAGATAADDALVPARYRKLPRPTGLDFCLVRDAGANQPPVEMPVIGVSNPAHWVTDRPINLLKITGGQHTHHCAPAVSVNNGDTLHVDRQGNGFFVRLMRGQQELMSRTFHRPQGHADGYLESTAPCTADCTPLDREDAYLYLIDKPHSASEIAKLAFLDFFPPELAAPPSDCDKERPEFALKRRSEVGACPLPSWVSELFDTAVPMIPGDTKQTGTGGGYEPP